MDKREIDKMYAAIRKHQETLREYGSCPRPEIEADIQLLRRQLRELENSFAAETPGAWVAMVCADYTWPDENDNEQPEKLLLPVSRFLGVGSTTQCYAYGAMAFYPRKRRGQVLGARFEAEYELYTGLMIREVPFCQSHDFGEVKSADRVELCLHPTREDAEGWLAGKPGIFPVDAATRDLARLKQKIAEQ